MKLIWLFILLLFFITPNFVEAQNNESILFENTEYGFSIAFPDHWFFSNEIIKDENLDSVSIVNFFDKENESNFNLKIVLIDDIYFEQMGISRILLNDLESWVINGCNDSTIETKGYLCENRSVLDSSIVNINNRIVYQIKDTWTKKIPGEQPVNIITMRNYIPHGPTLWYIEAVIKTEEFEEHQKDVTDAINSFKLSDYAEFKSYSNEKFGFTIKYPDGWIVDSDTFLETEAGTNILTFWDGKFGKSHSRIDVTKFNNTIFPPSEPAQYLQFVETFVEISCEEMNKTDPVFQCGMIEILDAQILDLSGQNRYHVSYDWLQIEPDGYSQIVHSTQTFIPVKDEIWRIYSVTWPRENIHHSGNDIYNIISSFSIYNSQENIEVHTTQKFTKTNSNYSFQIPSGWQKIEIPNEIISEYGEIKTNVSFILPIYYGTIPPSISFQEFEYYLGTDFFTKTDEELLQDNENNVVILGGDVNYVQILDQKVERFSESIKASTIAQFIPTTENSPVVYLEYVHWEFQNDESFIFMFSAEARDYDVNLTTFRSVLSSFEVEINPTDLNDGLIVLFTFLGTLLGSTGLVIFYSKINHSKTNIPKLGYFLLAVLILMGIGGLVYDLDSIMHGIDILANLVKTAPIEVYSYAMIFGIVAPLISFQSFKFVNKTLDEFSSDLKFVIKIAIFFFFFVVIEILITAFAFFFVGSLGFVDLSIKSDTLIREQISTFVFTFDGLKAPITSILFTLTLWMPLVFFVYFFKDMKKLKTKKGVAVILFLASILLFLIMLYFSSSTFSPLEEKNSKMLSLTSGSIIASIVIAFLSAEGYIGTIKEKIYKLRDLNKGGLDLEREKSKNIKNIWSKIPNLVILVITVIGFLRFFGLVFIIVDILPVDQAVIKLFEGIANIQFANNDVSHSFFIRDSFMLFFYGFLAYDFLMLYIGFKEGFLDRKNSLYRFIKNRIGTATTITIIASLLIFTGFGLMMTNFVQGTILLLPEDTRNIIYGGNNTESIIPLDENQKLLQESDIPLISAFLQGVVFVVGSLYVLRKNMTLKST